MQVYKGINALSEFHREKLLAQLQRANAAITDVHAEYVHFVDTRRKLSASGEVSLRKLLVYGMPFESSRGGTLFLVTPRPGTISPWSSKATDIAKNAGLKSIERIERGIAYYVHANV